MQYPVDLYRRNCQRIKSPFLKIFFALTSDALIILPLWNNFFRSEVLFESHLSDSPLFFVGNVSTVLSSFFSYSPSRVNYEKDRKWERYKRKGKRKVRDWVRDVNFIPANLGTGWSRSALLSTVNNEKKITKSTTIRFLDCQSSVLPAQSVKLNSRNRYLVGFIDYFIFERLITTHWCNAPIISR